MNSGIYVPPLTRINKLVIITLVSVFLLDSILRATGAGHLAPHMALSWSGILSGKIFQIFTYPFVSTGLFSLFFDCLIIWFIGGDLEILWGESKYLRFLLYSLLFAAGCYLGYSFFLSKTFVAPMLGVAGITYALLVAYGVLYGDRLMSFMLIFPMKAKYFCMILAGLQFYTAIFQAHASSSWGHLGAMIFAYFWVKGLGGFKKFKRKKKKKSHLYLVEEDDESFPNEKGPRYWQ